MDNQLDYEINKELGECYLFMGDFDKAEEYYRKAASNNAQSAALAFAFSFRAQQGRIASA